MKMMSTTSITSTMGVTLISETGGGAVFSFMTESPEIYRAAPDALLPALHGQLAL
jgi:hypothetical protein